MDARIPGELAKTFRMFAAIADLILSLDFAMVRFTDPWERICETACGEGPANLSLGTQVYEQKRFSF
jgi:hypothetical protein